MYSLLNYKVHKWGVYTEFDNLLIFKNKNNDLVHYSLTNRGNALYFQKIMINKIFRMVLKPSWDTNKTSVFKNYGGLNFGGDFQQKYALITILNQTKREITDTLYNNDSASYGSFKNHYYRSSLFGVSSSLKKYREAKHTHAFSKRVLEFGLHISSHGAHLYAKKVPSAFLIAEMKSGFISPIFDNYFSFALRDSIFNERFKDKLLTNITQAIFFIRTFWYKSALEFSNFERQFNFIENEGHYRTSLAKSDRYHWRFAGEEDLSTFSTLGYWVSDSLDVAKELRIRPRGGVYRRYVRKYIRWRLGIVHWGKKIMKFKKNYLFWNYARSLSNYFYRGFFMHSIFNRRVDVYIMRMFGIRTLRFSRLLVKAGHIFRGGYAITNQFDRIKRYDIMSISKKANIYLTKKRYFKYWKSNKNHEDKKIQSTLIKSSPLVYCRQHKDLSFYGEVKNIKYNMFFGNEINVFNLPCRKTRYFNLNYQFSQKIVATSWW